MSEQFNDGDRVMVKHFECPHQPSLIGYYGHVTGYYDEPCDFVPVRLVGCISTAPGAGDLEDVVEGCRRKPFPFHDWELEHAD